MQDSERRKENRSNPSLKFTPVTCVLVSHGEKIPVQVINYHYRGACFKVTNGDYRFQTKGAHLLFVIGMKELTEQIRYRVVWETVSDNGMFGVEFSNESSVVLSRSERFASHSINTPVVSSQDPLDPNRIVYFKVLNSSTTGMLISTSLSNKHIFPGMELKTAILTIPGIGKTDLDLFIENTRPGEDNQILFGVSVKGSSHNYNSLMAKYLSNLGSTSDSENQIEKLANANLLQKQLRAHLTIREVKSAKEYEQVLKLRFLGYDKAGKVESNKTWRDMGEGIENEGIILGAYLGGALVASCEFRLLKNHGLRLSSKINILQVPGIRSDNLAEINKLVVHPRAQSSDIVLGIFQKIHALAMLNGRPDGIIAAEPKLISLYERLGFKKTTVKMPHPVKPKTDLTVMVIYHEAYASSDGMNPYAWSVAFSESQKFFDEIGINKSVPLSPLQFLEKNITAGLVGSGLLNRRKKARSAADAATLQKSSAKDAAAARNVSDPKWTKQHLNASVLLPYVLVSIELIGEHETRRILLDFGFDPAYFRSVSNWVSIDFFDEFITRFSQFGDPIALNRKAGFRAMTKEVLGVNYFIVKHFFSPRIAFKSIERFLPKFNKTRIFQVVDAGHSFVRLRLTNPDKNLLPKHASTKENWYALCEAYVLALTGSVAKITPIKSAFDGDEYCEYIVSWKSPLISFRNIIKYLIGASLVVSPVAYSYTQFGAAGTTLLAGIVAGLLTVYYGTSKILFYQRKYREMLDSLTEFESHADERYKELQNSKSVLEKSYQEGKILEQIHRDIQGSDDLSNILQSGLDALCVQFDFKRAFAMIRDENSAFLRTSAVYGTDSPLEDLWNFKVDISVKRESPLVLSSVYHSSQSILIADLSEHKSRLNEPSRRLIERLGTRGFAIVPIPSYDGNWGVVVADKAQIKDVITRRDLVALQRVAQSLGLALDKKAKIESEARARRIFQKYVPATVVESTLGKTEPVLGGQVRETFCLFMDIRNFTKLSCQVPPEILIEILNQVFDLLQKNISKSNGIIDKFLGDGALVTWGAVPGSSATPSEVLNNVSSFLSDLDELNLRLVQKGLDPVYVGIGIHKGEVIAGNIGSSERMEFTVIGNPVNVASRLQQLTKVFHCEIIVSEQVTSFGDLGPDWKIHSDVQVRGLDSLIKIAALKWNATSIGSSKRETA